MYSEDRKVVHPAAHLAGFRGVLQVDGYAGFKRLAGERADDSIRLAFCWAHMRRPFYRVLRSTSRRSPREVLARIASSTRSRRRSVVIRPNIDKRSGRREVGRSSKRCSVVAGASPRVSGVSDLAKAMRYAMRHWPGLIAFLDDGRIEMDTNVVERAIRPVP